MDIDSVELGNDVCVRGYSLAVNEKGGARIRKELLGSWPWKTSAEISEGQILNRLYQFFDEDDAEEFLAESVRKGIPLPRNRTLRFTENEGMYKVYVQKN